jgi:hypothetical protein
MTDHRRGVGRARLLVLFAAVALTPLAARAQTEAQKREAKEHYEKATRLYEVEKYGDAIEEYQKVYLLVDDPNMLYNIGQAYRLWGKPEEAVRSYRNFLRRSPNAPNRADVEKKIADLEKAIEERKRAPVAPTPPPVVTPPVDTATTPPPPPPVTQPPVATTPPPLETPAVVVQPAPPPPSKGMRVASYVLLIGGGAFLATSVVAGAVASGKAQDLEKMSKDANHPVFDPSIERSGKSANRVAIATGVIGVAAAATGGILFLLSKPSATAQASLYPIVGPQLAGGGARVTF